MNPSQIRLRTSGYERVFLLSQYIGDFHPEAHVKGFAGFSLIALIWRRLRITEFFTMSKECSIYCDKRRIVLTKSIEKHYNNHNGLFIRYDTVEELSKILDFFQSTAEVENVFIKGESVQSTLEGIKKKFKLIVAAGGLVQNSKGEFLFIFRHGRWDLPKGKLEKGEEIEDAAVREVSEETGVTNLIIKHHIIDTYHTYKLGSNVILKKSHWFFMRYHGNETLVPQLNEDISIARWVPKIQLKEILQNTYDTIRDVIDSAEIN